MKKLNTILIALVFVIGAAMIINGCAASTAEIASKSGSKLWSENCGRCHNSPSPASFNAEQWETIGMHMQIRANLTAEETDKIVAFLKSSE